ncbi:hypothetical protein PALP01_0238 [Pseudomonas phage PA02]|nr:hypothetical protein PALP01_0238 [Pseudomonas phage PA02]
MQPADRTLPRSADHDEIPEVLLPPEERSERCPAGYAK